MQKRWFVLLSFILAAALLAVSARNRLSAQVDAAATATVTPAAASAALGITDPEQVVTPASLPLQPVGTPFVDPAFDTTLRRVSDRSEAGGFGTHIYSQLQAFSADNAYLLLIEDGGYVLRRLDDLSPVSGLDTAEWNAPRWQPAQSHTLVHYDSNGDTTLRAQYTNVDTLSTTTVFTFPAGYQRIRSNQSFDELSQDGRWMAGMASMSDGDQRIFALDLENLTLGAELSLSDVYAGACEPDPTWGEVEPDWVGVSPLGNYLVIQWQRDGTARCSGLETFDLQTGAFVGRAYDGHQHGDLGVDVDGATEFFMTFELAAPPPDNNFPAIGMRELPGTDTASEPTYLQVIDWIGSHISCQGPPGVCLVTTVGDESDGWSPMEGEVFLQYTDGAVLRLVHHRSTSCGYWVQPRASISRDGRHAVFASDWGLETGIDGCGASALGQGDPYVLDLSAGICPDFDGDREVDMDDVREVAVRWQLTVANPDPDGDPATPNYEARFDRDGDGSITAVDVVMVAVELGKPCE